MCVVVYVYININTHSPATTSFRRRTELKKGKKWSVVPRVDSKPNRGNSSVEIKIPPLACHDFATAEEERGLLLVSFVDHRSLAVRILGPAVNQGY